MSETAAKHTPGEDMIKPTDEQIERAARHITTNPSCCVTNYDKNMQAGVCGARLTYSNGDVRIVGHCGGPCGFVQNTLGEFHKNVLTIRQVVQALKYAEDT